MSLSRGRPVHFEIHAEEPERAARFYADVFGWKITKWENPGMEYWVIRTGEEMPPNTWQPGIDGGLVRRVGQTPAGDSPVNGFVCTITVDIIDEILQNVPARGGSIVLEKALVPTVGWLAYCKDTEGNIFGVLEPERAEL